MVNLERIQRLAEKLGNRKESLEIVRQMRCGGKKYPGGGKFFRTNLQNESPMMYQPILPSVPDVPTPMRYEPQPHLGLYEYPSTTGMAESYPVTLPPRIPVTIRDNTHAPVAVEEEPVIDLFSDKAKAERRLMQRYAESLLDDRASSPAGAKGPWQIMDITVQDYLNNGGKPGDIFNPEYNGGIRDWAFSVIPKRLGEFWSENDSDINKLAKLYAAYNWGAGNLKKFLRSRIEAGLSNDDPYEWVEAIKNKGKRPNETKNYVKFLALNQDIPDSYLTREKFENAARKRGYMAEGGNLYEMGGPEKQNWFTRMMLNSVMNDPYTGAVATASGWTRDKEGNVTQTEEAANSEGAKRLRTALAEIAAMPLTDLVVDIAGAAVVGTKTYKSIKLARELNKMLKAGEFDAAVDMAREASKAEPIVKASTTIPAGYPSSSDYSLTRIPAGLPAAEQPVNLVSLPDYAGQVRDAVKAGKWGNLRFYRNIDGVPYTTDSGLIRLGKDENALVNVTSDLPFRLHSDYKAAPGAEYLVIDPDAFIGKTPLSIEPMDTFFPNVGMDVEPKYVKIITGNKEIIPEIESKGMKALTSPELQDLYSKIGGDFGSDAAAAYRDAIDKYITENIGRPSLADYAHLEEVTGLKSGTVPLSEQEVYNAAKKASKEVEDTYDWMSKMGLDSGKYVRGLSGDIRWPYTYANGRDVSAISFSKEPIIGTGGKVFYDTAPPVEAGLMESLGSYSHPNIDRLNSILEFSLDPNGYHYFDPQIGKVGFIMPSPIRASGGKIHIKPENRGKFTALKKRTGHSASWFKAHGTPAQKKMAVFALNSRHWRHDNGGLLHALDEGYQLGQIYDLSEEQVNELIRQGYEVERV